MSLRSVCFCAAVLAATALQPSGLWAQSSGEPRQQPRTQPPRAQPPGPQTPPAQKDGEQGPPADSPLPGASEQTAPPPASAKLFGKLPQTADEKARHLADLYALLAAADDEAQAKKVAGRIERLWAMSGSDTVSLLLERSTKAMVDKNGGLAEKLLEMAIGLAPDHAEVFNRRAFFYFTQGNFQAAAGDLRRVLALDPNHYKALEGLAQIWKEAGNKRGAFEVIKKLLDVHPFAPGAKAVYEELKREVEGQGI